MLVQPDFSETQDTVGEGIYKVRITDAELGSWQGKDGKPDTQFVKWTMETYGEEDPKNNGRKVFDRTPATGGGAFRLKNFYKAAMGEEIGGEFDASALFGKEMEITVVDGKDKQGNPTGYTEIKAYKPIV